MDLGDFVPEVTRLRLSLGGRPYEIEWTEATVDDVFHMIAERPVTNTRDMVENHRRIVTRFFCEHLVAGDAFQLAEDLKTVPYRREGAPVDIERLYAPLVMRVKKKDSGGSPENP